MFGKVIEGFEGKFGERWLETLFTPALLFWAGGIVAWASAPHYRWTNFAFFAAAVRALDGQGQLIAAIAALLAVVASSVAVERFTLTLLRLLEGYWPAWASAFEKRAIAKWQQKRSTWKSEWDALAKRQREADLTRAEALRYVRLDRLLRSVPANPDDCMPTALGNVLRAAERRPAYKYGLDAVVCWPRLWLVMPDAAKEDVAQVRSRLNASARLLFWSAFFVVWVVWAPVAALGISILMTAYAYRSLLDDAAVYGDIVEAAFDVYRRALYAALGWAYPDNAAVEHDIGAAVTRYLLRGSADAAVTFKTGA